MERIHDDHALHLDHAERPQDIDIAGSAGQPYRLQPVNIDQREQFAPAFLEVSPNNEISAIVDDDVEGSPLAVFESGAILT